MALVQKWRLFQFFWGGNIGQENIFCDTLERKNAFLGLKTRTSKSRKIDIFSKGVNLCFWSKNGHFSNFFFFCNIRQENVFYAPCSLANKPCTVQCALLGVSSVCWENWTDTLICRNLATQLSGRLLIIPNQITQKPEIKTSSQQRWGQTRTEWELNAPMGLIRNHGRGNRVGKMFALHRSWTERGLNSHVRMFKYPLM